MNTAPRSYDGLIIIGLIALNIIVFALTFSA